MASKGKGMAGLALLLLGLAVGLLACGGEEAPGPAGEEGGTEGVTGRALVQVDADPAIPGVQKSVTVSVNQTFKIRWNVNPGGTGPYNGYQAKMAFEETLVNAVSGAPLGVMCGEGQTCVGAGPVISNDPDALEQGTIFAGEALVDPLGQTSDFAGDAYEVELRCVAEGTSPLDLRVPPDDPLGQITYLAPSPEHPTDTADAEVVCSGAPSP